MDFEIIDYSERAIAVFGNTQAIKDDLIALGGRFNPNLTVDGERRAGWIFSAKKRSKVEELCNATSVHTTSNHTSKDSHKESKNNMEFHIAIKNILKYQGKDFLLDPKMVNALVDFQAYEFHPAMKNIFRTLHSDNYIAKIAQYSAWDASCDQLVYEVERDYAFPRDLIEYIFKSVAYGTGALSSVTAPSSNTQPQKKQPSAPQPNTPNKSWKKMSSFEKAETLEKLLDIDHDSFSDFGLNVNSFSISSVDEYDHKYITFSYELTLTGAKRRSDGSVIFAFYDTNGRLRESKNSYTEIHKIHKRLIENPCFDISMPFTNIGRILIYMKPA